MRFVVAALLALASVAEAGAAPAVDPAGAEPVVTRCVSIYHESGHPCACPFDHARNGSLCGARSAHDRLGGASPVCLVTEVTPELLADSGRTSKRSCASGATTMAGDRGDAP